MNRTDVVRKIKLIPRYTANKIEKWMYLWGGFYALCPQLKNWWLYVAAVFRLLPSGRLYTFEYKNGMHISFRAGTYDAQVNLEIFGYDTYAKYIERDIPSMRRFVDLGGQTGVFTLYMLSKNKALRGVCVEAVGENFAIMQKNIRQNGFDDSIVLHHRAAWRESGGSVRMHISSVNSGGHSAVRDGHGYTDGEWAETISLAGIIGGQQCDLLKVDIEGAEYEVFCGSDTDTLSKIARIIMEVHGTKEENASLAARLRAAGFTVILEGHYISASRETV